MKNRRKFLGKSLMIGAIMGISGQRLSAFEPPKDKLDSEFSEIFTHFLGEIESSSQILNPKQRTASILGALIAAQSAYIKEFVKDCMQSSALNAIEVREILYQSVPYVGFGRAYSGFEAIFGAFNELKIALPLAPQGNTNRANRYEKGLDIQVQIFGEALRRASANASADTQHIFKFLSSNCFGDYYTRNGLSLRLRELLTFVFIASLGGCENQLKAHTQGNLNMKNDRQILIATLTAICPYIGYPRTLNALSVVNEVTKG